METHLVYVDTYSTSEEELPQYLHNSDRLPPYSKFPEVPTPEALSDHYELHSRRMVLDLGQRYQSIPVAATGREGLVEGRVWVQSFENVEKIQVTLSGAVVSTSFEFGIPTRPVVERLTHQTLTLWSRGGPQHIDDPSRPLPFALLLPEHVEGMVDNSGQPVLLPPSASIVTRSNAAHIAYTIRVDMFRKGWRSHDRIDSEILYLPRTTVRYFQPYFSLPNSEKPLRSFNEDWNVATLPPASKKSYSGLKFDQKAQMTPHLSMPQSVREDVVVRLWLPDGLRYPAGRKILWHVTFVFPKIARIRSASSLRSGSSKSSSDLNDYSIDALVAGVSLRLVCISAVVAHGSGSRQERVLAEGEVFNIRPNMRTELGERKLAVTGFLQSGNAEQEMSWKVPGFASVSYEIRLSIKPDGPDAPVWEYSERITLTSHETDVDVHNVGGPALLLPGATRDPVPLALLGL